MPQTYTNTFASGNQATQLASGINNSVTTIPVLSVSNLPASGNFTIRIDNELILVGGISALNLTSCTRGVETGYNASAAASHSAGAGVYIPLTAGTLDNIRIDQVQYGLAGSLPSTTGQKKGNVYLYSDAPGGKWFDGAAWQTIPAAVTSVALSPPAEFTVSGSPITSAGTITLTKVAQVANAFWAGPSSGGSAVPVFRSLVTADLPAGVGTVTSVALTAPVEFTVAGSPVTSTGTLAVTKAPQVANAFWAGPSSGGSAVPVFRSLVTADLPAGVGSVTSVAMTVPAEFSVSGSPITSSGTLAISKLSQLANKVYAGPTSGGSAVPAFRSLVAADIPTFPVAGGNMWVLTPPVIGSFTWANQGGASVVSGSNFLSILAPASGSTQLRMLYQACPGTPWDLYALVQASGAWSGADYNCGLIVYDGTKIVTFCIQGGAGTEGINVYKFNSVTSFNGTTVGTSFGLIGYPVWLHIHNDGTTLTFYYSFDGVAFYTYATLGVTAFLSAATNYGFYANSENSNPASCTILSFGSTLTAL